MKPHRLLTSLAVALSLLRLSVAAESIADAYYASPVNRYGHFALGPPHEYARLIVMTGSGRELMLQLAEDEVFEDLVPRRVKLAPDVPDELLTIVCHRRRGARLVLVRPGSNAWRSVPNRQIGTPMRWLNPVDVADLDGDGRAEIATVFTPHIGGMLKVYRRSGEELIEIAALADFSNLVYGSNELALSTPMSIGGRMQLVVPDATRRFLRIVALEGERLVETGAARWSRPSPAPFKPSRRAQFRSV